MSGQISAGAGAQNVAAAAVQKAQSAAAQAIAKEGEKQFSNALGSAFGGRRK